MYMYNCLFTSRDDSLPSIDIIKHNKILSIIL